MAQTGTPGFADLLDRTFSLLSRTWKTSLALGAVLFLPSSVLFGWAYGAFLDAMKDLGGISPADSGSFLAHLGIAYLWIGLAVLVQGVVFLFVRACVTDHAARASRGESPTTRQIAAHVIARSYGLLLGQRGRVELPAPRRPAGIGSERGYPRAAGGIGRYLSRVRLPAVNLLGSAPALIEGGIRLSGTARHALAYECCPLSEPPPWERQR